ncbi:hypothetical protein HDU82_005106 [Entophlyctis luteolus]|nr:hypothetical protein HDU82_005106 [Entophlyctis luteolus]
MHIDGFAVNIQPPFSVYLPMVDTMYEAARQLGNDFSLCLSFDMTYNYTEYDVTSTITRYMSHPNQLTIDHNGVNKIFVSTFRGEAYTFGHNTTEDGWKNGIIQPLANNGTPIYFVPNFWVDASNDFFESYDYLDGIFSWWCYPSRGFSTNDIFSAVSANEGKTYIEPITPWFYKHNSVGNWYQGDYNIIDQWMNVIQLDPGMVELVTWNDFSEATYIGSYSAPVFADADGVKRNVSDHEAFGVLSSFFIDWYKKGAQPEIIDDEIFFWFRPHSSSAVATSDPLGLPKWLDGPYTVPLQDRIYGVVFLTDDATVTVHSGNAVDTVFAMSKGWHTLPNVTFVEGQQAVSVSRMGREVKTVVARVAVNNTISRYDFNVVAAYG